jgi:hypothetical protein
MLLSPESLLLLNVSVLILPKKSVSRLLPSLPLMCTSVMSLTCSFSRRLLIPDPLHGPPSLDSTWNPDLKNQGKFAKHVFAIGKPGTTTSTLVTAVVLSSPP